MSVTTTETDQQEEQPRQLELSDLEINKIHKVVYEQFRATDHLALCSSSNAQFNTNCFTGVRVYDGSKILGAFLLSNKSIQKFITKTQSNNNNAFSIIELGCGCGLSGICALEVILSSSSKKDEIINSNNSYYSITFTDMQPSCLELAKKNAERMMMSSSSSHNIEKSKTDSVNVECHAEPLRWDPEGFADFQSRIMTRMINNNNNRKKKFNLILGAELIYFRVDMTALVSTIKNLMMMNRDDTENDDHADDDKKHTTPTICLLCHVNRVTNGRVILPQILTQQFGLSYKLINMRPCLAAMEDSGYLDTSMSASFMDRVDFLAIGLSEEDLCEVFSDPDVDFVVSSASSSTNNNSQQREEKNHQQDDDDDDGLMKNMIDDDE